jgi:hypothetical protein
MRRDAPGSPAPAPVRTPSGATVLRNSQGRVTAVRTPSGAVIQRAPSGVRRVEVVRSGGRVVVARAPGHGYVQRQMMVNNRAIVKRTYVVGGVSYARVYRPVTYRGVVLNVYTPARYYRPAYYTYAYTPWSRPVIYNWGWGGSPWYGYYGGYFTPYPVYSSPTMWLTDYLVSSTLQSAYEERAAAGPPLAGNEYGPGPVALTPDVKQAVADEVRRQVDMERSEGQAMSANPNQTDNLAEARPMFADNGTHVFVSNASLPVSSSAGDCTISEGSVLQMAGPPPLDANSASLVVLASQRNDCSKGSTVSVQLQDLQEMQNHMRETIDRGLGDLQSRQGQGGIPALPAGAAGTIDTPLAAEATPDQNVTGELTQVAQEADRADQEALAQAPPPGGTVAPGTAPVTLSMGQSMEEVFSIQGAPQKIIDLGAKKIYIYRDLKITFIDGRVSDVQ